MNAEEKRLQQPGWKKWGPYLSERQWGTVREDYSEHGEAWDYFTHDHARSRVYRWGEDGIAGISDDMQKICFSVALWNGRDPILKERMFGLTGNEGNHGEDVKECYYYLDSTPTHSYMKFLYKYPQQEFPYASLVEENRRRGRGDREFELADTGIFDQNRYFDVFIEYAKADVEDILVRITVENRGPEPARLHVLPTVWFRNTWSWGRGNPKPRLKRCGSGPAVIELTEPDYGKRWMVFDGQPNLIFTENDTNSRRLFQYDDGQPYKKDAFHEYVIHGHQDAVNAAGVGTKAAAVYVLDVPARGTATIRLRLTDSTASPGVADSQFDEIFAERKSEADEFYSEIIPQDLSADAQNVMRQSFAGLLWSKQFYHYVVSEW